MAAGIGGTGEGFDAPSAGRVGFKNPMHRTLSRFEVRAAATKVRDSLLRSCSRCRLAELSCAPVLQAAEDRQRVQRLMTSGGKTLGGGSKPTQRAGQASNPQSSARSCMFSALAEPALCLQAAADAALRRFAQTPADASAAAKEPAPAKRPKGLINLADSDDDEEPAASGQPEASGSGSDEQPQEGGCGLDDIAGGTC